MGLFGGKDDSKAKIEELKAKMAAGGAPQPWQQQPWQPPQQPDYGPPPQMGWQPPREQHMQHHRELPDFEIQDEITSGLVLDLGDGMSLNLPVKSRMRLDEFLKIADRVRELKKIEHLPHF